ncbi:hypothetical protein [Paraburkholderia caffeinilytica]
MAKMMSAEIAAAMQRALPANRFTGNAHVVDVIPAQETQNE